MVDKLDVNSNSINKDFEYLIFCILLVVKGRTWWIVWNIDSYKSSSL